MLLSMYSTCSFEHDCVGLSWFSSGVLQERNNAAALEKKQKQIDKQITEWKTRYDEKEAELANSQREAHASSTEVRIYVCMYTGIVLYPYVLM